MTIESAVLEDLYERSKAAREIPDLEPEEVELIINNIRQQVSKLDRMCNSIIGHQHGVSVGIVDSLQLMKVNSAHLRWHLDQAKPSEAP
jgi:hypothetical protein